MGQEMKRQDKVLAQGRAEFNTKGKPKNKGTFAKLGIQLMKLIY